MPPEDDPRMDEQPTREEWEAAMDKPAATVHGTGSGEPCICGHVNHPNDSCLECGCSGYTPTPPASHTVTLDRETLDKLREAWATRSVNFEHNCVTLDFGAAEEIEALLRAAERQK